MTGSEIREAFLRYFEGYDHKIVRSSSLVPQADPTLLFTNAGMVQFKSVFLGEEVRPYRRATSSQKCVRAGGKHNDLETVGLTGRHHTFFEMLGNFSFGDYFKEGAIEMAWELLTEVLRLPPEKMVVTIYEEDEEANELWQAKAGVPEEMIFRCGEKDNFWAMGDTGPCGPCSEIHYDFGPTVGCGRSDCGVECECDRFSELWNLVFMQFNRDASGKMTPLPKPSIDTGMGLERAAAILQGFTDNFRTDLFRPVVEHINELTGAEYDASQESRRSIRVVSDHARSTAFLLADGVMPSNEGRGYVLRRIIRRACRHARLLGTEEPILYKVCGTVVDTMGEVYPELEKARHFIARVVQSEEERFTHTLDYGLKILFAEIEKAKASGQKTLPAQTTFSLYDTYGFPVDLTQEIAAEHGLAVDLAGHEAAMDEQRTRARASWKGADEEVASVYISLANEMRDTRFVGYDSLQAESRVKAILVGEQRRAEAGEGSEVEIILDVTPFYAETGGQVGDTGTLVGDETLVKVSTTVAPLLGLFVHRGTVMCGSVRVEDKVCARIDEERRQKIVLNHSATHLLHAALRQVLGDHVKQSGSLVAPDRLRFDFSHFSPITPRELHRIEELVNRRIRENVPISTEHLAFDEALERGATALFGEKYGEEVRVIRMGDTSMELCGGTHARATGDIGLFKIVHEGSVAAGVRRIEALTGEATYQYINEEEDMLARIRSLTKAKPMDEANRVAALLDRLRELEKENRKLRDRLVARETGGAPEDRERVQEVKGVQVLVKELEGADAASLRTFIDSGKARLKSGVIVVGTVADGKTLLAVGVTKDLTERLHAGKIINEIASVVEGSGGGRADLAQAGGKNTSRLPEALKRAPSIIESML